MEPWRNYRILDSWRRKFKSVCICVFIFVCMHVCIIYINKCVSFLKNLRRGHVFWKKKISILSAVQDTKSFSTIFDQRRIKQGYSSKEYYKKLRGNKLSWITALSLMEACLMTVSYSSSPPLDLQKLSLTFSCSFYSWKVEIFFKGKFPILYLWFLLILLFMLI